MRFTPPETGGIFYFSLNVGGDMANEKKLTDKQKRFCEEYIVDLNATQAAIRAGYSEKTARFTAAENLTKPNIQTYISELQKQQSKRTEITADRVLEELAAIAFSDRSKFSYVTNNGVRFTPTEELTDGEKRSIAGIIDGKNGIEIKSYDKLRALELIGKHIGMFEKNRADQEEPEDDGFIEALNGTASEDWSEDDE